MRAQARTEAVYDGLLGGSFGTPPGALGRARRGIGRPTRYHLLTRRRRSSLPADLAPPPLKLCIDRDRTYGRRCAQEGYMSGKITKGDLAKKTHKPTGG